MAEQLKGTVDPRNRPAPVVTAMLNAATKGRKGTGKK